MAKRNGRCRSLEEAAPREKIRELLELADVNGLDDIQQLFRETIAEFMEDGLDSELNEHLEYDRYDAKEKTTDDSRRNGHSRKIRRTRFGDTTIQIPRDRKDEFDPVIMLTNQTSIS